MTRNSTNKKNSDVPTVISASRRTDLVCCHQDYLIEKLKEYPPEKVHTVVIWTKNPYSMISSGLLRSVLSSYSQLYIHLTVTGLGGTILEPGIPPWEKVVAMIPGIVDLVKNPERISWRFDPIVRVGVNGEEISNYHLFQEIADHFSCSGITTCRTSWVEPYRKVMRRLENKEIRLLPHTREERLEHAKQLSEIAGEIGMQIMHCSMDEFPVSRCIDGKLFSRLHPQGLECSFKKAKGQRKLCGCTESLDIGWYSMKCPNGCLYCYAEPII